MAWRGLLLISGGVAALLLAFAGRYGFHRDELYFLRAGSEPAWGYVDQPPLTPLLAHATDVVFAGSIWGIRLPSALMGGLVVLVTGLIARELGGDRAAQLLAAASMGVAATLYVVSHMLSTTTLDLLVWTVLSWLFVRALGRRTSGDGRARDWLAIGVVGGIGLQNKVLVAFLLGAMLVSVLVAGPRSALRSPWPWVAVAIAAAAWTPNLLWQAANGWPQLAVSSTIASGGSGSSQERWAFLPFQLLLISPALVPVWAIGWWRLWRSSYRAFAVTYVLLAVVFLVTGGKPYYLVGVYPVLLAAGAPAVVAWARRRSDRSTLPTALGISLVAAVVLMLPVLPERALGPIVAINYDAGETVGWPALVSAVARAHGDAPGTVVLTENYGQAGAVDHFRPDLGPAYSGHMSYADWGPPPASTRTAVVVGYSSDELDRWFADVRLATRVDNGVGLDNDEQGTPIWLVGAPRTSWESLWPSLRRV